MVLRKTPVQISHMRRAGRVVAEMHEECIRAAKPGATTADLDRAARDVLDRLAGRRVCENCQRVYHVTMPPTTNWSCDTCGGKVVQRDDDTEEAVERRLELYERETVPIIDYYCEQSLLEVVDGMGEGDVVYDRILMTVEDRMRSKTRGPA